MSKQTAVEWLENQLKERHPLMNSEPLFEQANKMFEEQIVTAHYQGYRNHIGTTEVSEQYYNETYKGGEQ